MTHPALLAIEDTIARVTEAIDALANSPVGIVDGKCVTNDEGYCDVCTICQEAQSLVQATKNLLGVLADVQAQRDQWLIDVCGYPFTVQGNAAKAAVDLCGAEIDVALDPYATVTPLPERERCVCQGFYHVESCHLWTLPY
jgi:hypothetical protein